jgi:hypothetical protein
MFDQHALSYSMLMCYSVIEHFITNIHANIYFLDITVCYRLEDTLLPYAKFML